MTLVLILKNFQQTNLRHNPSHYHLFVRKRDIAFLLTIDKLIYILWYYAKNLKYMLKYFIKPDFLLKTNGAVCKQYPQESKFLLHFQFISKNSDTLLIV